MRKLLARIWACKLGEPFLTLLLLLLLLLQDALEQLWRHES
jgi:hypothetical protein